MLTITSVSKSLVAGAKDSWQKFRAGSALSGLVGGQYMVTPFGQQAEDAAVALVERIGIVVTDWTDRQHFYATMDLDTDGRVLDAMNSAHYPEANRRVRWVPVVGIAATGPGGRLEPVEAFKRDVWNGLFTGLATELNGLNGMMASAFDLCGDDRGDLVVTTESQINHRASTSDNLQVAEVFYSSVHSVSAQDYPTFGPLVLPELNRPQICSRILSLLHGPPRPNKWIGEIR